MAVEPIGVREGRVLGGGIGAIVILLVVRQGLTTYFTKMNDLELETKRVAGGVERIHAFRAEEDRTLDRARTSLDNAMRAATNKQRSADPKQSTDTAPVDGWKELPKGPPPAWPLPPPLPVLEVPDGGADAASDAASSDASAIVDARAPTAGDASAPQPPQHHH